MVWIWTAGFAQALVIMLGAVVTLQDPQWLSAHRGKLLFAFFVITILGLAATIKSGIDSSDATTRMDNNITSMVKAQAIKQARDDKRWETFYIPLARLIERADIAVISAKDIGGGDVNERVHAPKAKDWLAEGKTLLKLHCSDAIAKRFTIPHYDRMGFPIPDNLLTTNGIIYFYESRKGILEDVQRNASALCDK